MAEVWAKNSDNNFECIYLASVTSSEFMFVLSFPYIGVLKNDLNQACVEREDYSCVES